MANNRLYIGNKETKATFCLTKAYNNWNEVTERELPELNAILETDDIWKKTTNLVFFTESDDEMWSYFFGDGTF